ncbi:MAG: TauD/TfdA family dioxygenase [Proteobacteria bacterium]|nr:TauD/TfdA family dioxygenase [Pseudomonadota bacterium]
MTLEIRPLSDALGAEVTGLDLTRPLSSKDLAAVKQAYMDHHLLCLRSAPLTPPQFAAFSKQFGEPQLQLVRRRRDEVAPEVAIHETTYEKPEDKPDDMHMIRLSGWHTDDSFMEEPCRYTLLQSINIPDSGGHTRFCNVAKAYADLAEAEKQRLENLKAVHNYDTRRAPARPTALTQTEKSETHEVVHPLVITHPETGTKAIYYNFNRTDRVVDMDRADSDALLDWINEKITQPRYRYEHEWRVGDILFWDNRGVIHSVNMDFPVGQKRIHQRVMLKGDRPA